MNSCIGLPGRGLTPQAVGAAVLAAMVLSVGVATATTPEPASPYGYVRDEVEVTFREPPGPSELEAFQANHHLGFVLYVGALVPPGLGWYTFRIIDGGDLDERLAEVRLDPRVCTANRVAYGTWDALGSEPPTEEARQCQPLPTATPVTAVRTDQPTETAKPPDSGTANAPPASGGASPPSDAQPASGAALLLSLAVIVAGGCAGTFVTWRNLSSGRRNDRR